MKANIGGDKFTTIKESWKYFYVFEALKVVNIPGQDLQQQQYQRRPIQTKIEADRFAAGFRKANYVAAKLIHDPVKQRATEKEEALAIERAAEEAKEQAIREAEAAKKEAEEKAKKAKEEAAKKRTSAKKQAKKKK